MGYIKILMSREVNLSIQGLKGVAALVVFSHILYGCMI